MTIQNGILDASALNTLMPGKRSAAYHLVRKLSLGLEDATMIVCGDSTYPWIWKLIDKLAVLFPAYTVKRFTNFSPTTGTFALVTTIQTGSGSKEFRAYEYSVGGSKPTYYLGCQQSGSAIKPANDKTDLILMNHGHNIAIPQSVPECVAPYMASCMRQIAAAHPGAPMVMTIQNPIRSGDTSMFRQSGCLMAARMLGAQPFDIHVRFERAGRPSAWYLDDVHPSTLAGDLISDWAIEELFTNVGAPWFSGSAFGWSDRDNLLANGQFDAFSAGAASGWTATNCTLTEDITAHETGARAIVLTPSAAGGAYIEQSISGAALARFSRQLLMVTARLKTPAGQNIATCPVEIRYDGIQVALSPYLDSGAYRGSFFEHAAGWGGADMDRTKNLTVRVYVDPAVDARTTSITVDRVHLGPMHGFQG